VPHDLLHCLCKQIEELEQARELGDKTELDELLDNARKEKDTLESQVALLQEQLSRSQCETARLRDQLVHLQEECKVRHAGFSPICKCNDNVWGNEKDT
jgi:transcription elongation GreA/GreB family factor